jgi:septal ring factor EnvC (AmiA/AmiB activator)
MKNNQKETLQNQITAIKMEIERLEKQLERWNLTLENKEKQLKKLEDDEKNENPDD